MTKKLTKEKSLFINEAIKLNDFLNECFPLKLNNTHLNYCNEENVSTFFRNLKGNFFESIRNILNEQNQEIQYLENERAKISEEIHFLRRKEHTNATSMNTNTFYTTHKVANRNYIFDDVNYNI